MNGHEAIELAHGIVTLLWAIFVALCGAIVAVVSLAFKYGRKVEADEAVKAKVAIVARAAKDIPIIRSHVERHDEFQERMGSEFPRLRERVHVAEAKLGLSPGEMPAVRPRMRSRPSIPRLGEPEDEEK